MKSKDIDKILKLTQKRQRLIDCTPDNLRVEFARKGYADWVTMKGGPTIELMSLLPNLKIKDLLFDMHEIVITAINKEIELIDKELEKI